MPRLAGPQAPTSRASAILGACRFQMLGHRGTQCLLLLRRLVLGRVDHHPDLGQRRRWGLRRWRRPEAVRVKAVLAAAASYATLFLLLLWQALRGHSLVAPDAWTIASIAIWAVATLLVFGGIGVSSRRASRTDLDWIAV